MVSYIVFIISMKEQSSSSSSIITITNPYISYERKSGQFLPQRFHSARYNTASFITLYYFHHSQRPNQSISQPPVPVPSQYQSLHHPLSRYPTKASLPNNVLASPYLIYQFIKSIHTLAIHHSQS